MSHPTPSGKIPRRLVGFGAFAVTVGLAMVLPSYGQTPEEHAKHHPKGGDTAMPAAGKDVAMPAAGMDGMMDGMMKKMGVPPPKDLYPTLMSSPDLTPEQREQVRSQADERMRSAVALLSEGLEKLAAATEIEDFAAMQDATAQVREAVARFESRLGCPARTGRGQAAPSGRPAMVQG